jgi:hypothetical protein
VAALLTRLPFAAQRMWDHDSIQFALGVERFNLAAHHPHPPGYPLYIALLKLLTHLGIDSLHGMVGITILVSALGAGLMVPLVARLAAEASPEAGASAAWAAGVLAAALFVFNPILWFYGELPLVYAVEGGLAVAVAWSAFRMDEGSSAFFVACAVYAVVGGLRPTTMVLLAPLFLFGVVRAWRRGQLTPGRLVAGAVLVVAIVLAWFVPLCRAAGGFAAYQAISREHFQTLLPATSIVYGAGWPALRHNLEILVKWAIQGVFPGGVALVLAWIVRPALAATGVRRLVRALPWLLIWAVPPMAFFALFHITKAGYTLIHLPALLVMIALLVPLAPKGSERPERWTPMAIAVVAAALIGGGLFLFGQDRRSDQAKWWAIVRNEFNQGALSTYERDLDALVAWVHQYPSESTVLGTVELSGTGAASAEGFLYPWQRHLQWYLPRYPVLWLVPEQDLAFVTQGHRPFIREQGMVDVPPETQHVLLVLSKPTGDRLRLPGGHWIGSTFYVVDLPFQRALRLGPLVLVGREHQEAA